jgi:hypothetical protein
MSTYKELFASEPKLAEVMENSALSQDARVNTNTRGHVWELNNFGHVEIDGSTDYHNFVTCEKCGYVYCIACHDRPQKDCTK